MIEEEHLSVRDAPMDGSSDTAPDDDASDRTDRSGSTDSSETGTPLEETDAATRPDIASLVEDSDFVHRLVRAYMESDRFSEDEELRLLRAILSGES